MAYLNTFICEYSILPEHATRDMCMTVFGGMTLEDDEKELGDVVLLGRWACVGEARGYCVAQASNVASLQAWLNNWVSMADIKVTPCLDDNQQRELILKEKPSYLVNYNTVDAEPKDGESLYFIKYSFKEGCKNDGFRQFSLMTEIQDTADPGNCTSYGRWHVPSQGCGYGIASSPSVFDIYKWAYNWNDLCDVVVMPVTGDKITRGIIQNGLGFKVKHAAIMNEMMKLTKQKSMISRICGC